jgi:hypothetical protein
MYILKKKTVQEYCMKKIVAVVVALCVLGLVGCASEPTGRSPAAGSSAEGTQTSNQSNKVPGSFPQFIKDALRNVPDDVLVGIGVAKLASVSQSMTISSTRARADISRQMNTMIQDMVRDYQASSEVDPSAALSFQENITVALSKSTLEGSRVVEQDQSADGSVWTVVWLGKNDVVREISQAQAAARLAVPAMASFNAEARMNEAFSNAAAQEYQANDR